MRWRVKYRVHLGVTFAPSAQVPEILIMSHSFDSGHPDSSLEDSAKGSDRYIVLSLSFLQLALQCFQQ